MSQRNREYDLLVTVLGLAFVVGVILAVLYLKVMR